MRPPSPLGVVVIQCREQKRTARCRCSGRSLPSSARRRSTCYADGLLDAALILARVVAA
jgi:hypothetical protein